MAEVQQIANLEITITDNSTGAAKSVRDFADALIELRKASSNKGLTKIANNVAAMNDADFSGFGRLQQALTAALRPAQQLADTLDRITKASGKSLSATISAVKKSSEGLQEKANAAQQGTITSRSDVTADIEQATVQTTSLRDAYISLYTGIKTIEGMNSAWADVSKKLNDANSSTAKFREGLKAVGTAGKSVLQGIIPSGLRNIVSQFGRLLRMKVMRTIIANLLKGFSEGLQNVYYWAKATGDGFANSMDTITTSLNYVKNSIGAAFSTLLNQIAPIIDRIIDWLVQGINYVNMFFAVLAGSDTYTKAKKVAVEYGNAAAGAIGGATGAAKELKAELSTLGFDELNQLQEQATGGSGGGGGGGTGGGGTNYNDMFERAAIGEQTKAIFEDILDYVKAIGAGILAWKVSNALLNALGVLGATQKAIGIGLMVGGGIISYEGGYDLGKNGFRDENGLNLAGIIKAALGVTATAVGGALVFGAAGAVIGLTLGIGLTVYGYLKGFNEQGWEKLQENPEYQKAMERLQKAQESLTVSQELIVKVKGIKYEYDDKMSNADAAQAILDKLKLYNGIEATAGNLAEVQRLINALNTSGVLGDLSASWDTVNGKISINVEELQNAIDKYKEYAREAALAEYILAQVKAQNELTVAEAQRYQAFLSEEQYLAMIRSFVKDNGLEDIVDDFFGGNLKVAWNPEQGTAPLLTSAGGNQELYELMSTYYGYYQEMGTWSEKVDASKQVIEETQLYIDALTGAVKENTTAVNANTTGIIGKDFSEVKPLSNNSNIAGGKVTVSGITGGRIVSPISAQVEKDIKNFNKGTDDASSNLRIFAMDASDTSNEVARYGGAAQNAGAATKQYNIDITKTGAALHNYNDESVDAVSLLGQTTTGWKQNKADALAYGGGLNTATAATKTFGSTTTDMIGQAKRAISGFEKVGDNMVWYIVKAFNGLGIQVNPKQILQAIMNAFYNTTKTSNFTYIGKAFADGITDAIKANLNRKTISTSVKATNNGVTYTVASAPMKIEAYEYAKGGMNIDAGTLMIAGENGAEAVGTINGRTGVANRDQIADAIAKALTPMLGNYNNRQETTNIDLYLDSQIVARATARGQKAMQKQFNLTARA